MFIEFRTVKMLGQLKWHIYIILL